MHVDRVSGWAILSATSSTVAPRSAINIRITSAISPTAICVESITAAPPSPRGSEASAPARESRRQATRGAEDRKAINRTTGAVAAHLDVAGCSLRQTASGEPERAATRMRPAAAQARSRSTADARRPSPALTIRISETNRPNGRKATEREDAGREQQSRFVGRVASRPRTRPIVPEP